MSSFWFWFPGCWEFKIAFHFVEGHFVRNSRSRSPAGNKNCGESSDDNSKFKRSRYTRSPSYPSSDKEDYYVNSLQHERSKDNNNDRHTLHPIRSGEDIARKDCRGSRTPSVPRKETYVNPFLTEWNTCQKCNHVSFSNM